MHRLKKLRISMGDDGHKDLGFRAPFGSAPLPDVMSPLQLLGELPSIKIQDAMNKWENLVRCDVHKQLRSQRQCLPTIHVDQSRSTAVQPDLRCGPQCDPRPPAGCNTAFVFCERPRVCEYERSESFTDARPQRRVKRMDDMLCSKHFFDSTREEKLSADLKKLGELLDYLDVNEMYQTLKTVSHSRTTFRTFLQLGAGRQQLSLEGDSLAMMLDTWKGESVRAKVKKVFEGLRATQVGKRYGRRRT